ncbi:dUTP diphosphatase [Phycicoccus elongatus]|uniref:dUTP diphosphatase n=1 Tax=Phycicoccus elongatus TaxID=101689 RepID=UPI003D80B90E
MTVDADKRVAVRRLHPQAVLPAYARPGDAGADLASTARVTLEPGERALVPTGIAIAIPQGHVGLVHPRSGAAARLGLSIVNAPGTVDSGYRGEIMVNLVNLDPRTPIEIHPGDRIAQLVIQEYVAATFTEADSLPDSDRGETGHGSTGGFAAGCTTTRT